VVNSLGTAYAIDTIPIKQPKPTNIGTNSLQMFPLSNTFNGFEGLQMAKFLRGGPDPNIIDSTGAFTVDFYSLTTQQRGCAAFVVSTTKQLRCNLILEPSTGYNRLVVRPMAGHTIATSASIYITFGQVIPTPSTPTDQDYRIQVYKYFYSNLDFLMSAWTVNGYVTMSNIYNALPTTSASISETSFLKNYQFSSRQYRNPTVNNIRYAPLRFFFQSSIGGTFSHSTTITFALDDVNSPPVASTTTAWALVAPRTLTCFVKEYSSGTQIGFKFFSTTCSYA
jgi:hypothetical protein